MHRTKLVTGCLALFCLLFPRVVHSKVVPCVEEQRGRWVVTKQKCVQYTREEAAILAETKLGFKNLKLEVGNLRLQLDKRDAALLQWRTVRLPSWKEQEKQLLRNIQLGSEQTALWRTTALELKNLRPVVKAEWWKHPIFVGTLSFLAGAAIMYGASQLYVQTLPATR